MKKKPNVRLSVKRQFEFDILYKSLIGCDFEVVESSNSKIIGLRGVLVYESAKLFYIQVGDCVKRVLKNNVKIRVLFKGKKVIVDGYALMGTLVQRIKKIK